MSSLTCMCMCACQEPRLLPSLTHTLIYLHLTHAVMYYGLLFNCFVLMLTQVLSLMQLLGWSCDMHVTDNGQSNDLKALDVVLIKPHMPMVCVSEVLCSQCLSYLLPFS